jgi:hypothetical protein
MIYALARDIDARLTARKFPVRVVYGPERTTREGYAPVIVVERDRTASDTVGPPKGTQRNPRKYMTRTLAVSATIYAQSSLPGAMIQDHERSCEQLVDAFLVSLYEHLAAEQAGTISVSSARYLAASERNDVETWPGVVYVIKFFVPRAVLALDYTGEAKPTAAAPGFVNAVRVSIDGENYEIVP